MLNVDEIKKQKGMQIGINDGLWIIDYYDSYITFLDLEILLIPEE